MNKIILFILLFASSLFAQNTYYVDGDAGDDSRNSTQAQVATTPWKTYYNFNLNGAGDVSDGDTIKIKAGTTINRTDQTGSNDYHWAWMNVDGIIVTTYLDSNNIYVSGVTGIGDTATGRAVINGEGWDALCLGRDDVKDEDGNLVYDGDYGSVSGGTGAVNLEFHNIDFGSDVAITFNADDSYLVVQWGTSSCEANTFNNCKIDFSNTPGRYPSEDQDNEPFTHNGDDHVFTNNYILGGDGQRQGIYAAGDNLTIANNIISGFRDYGIKFAGDNSDVYGNLLIDAGALGLKDDTDNANVFSNIMIVTNNADYYTQLTGVAFDLGSTSYTPSDNIIANNTIILNGAKSGWTGVGVYMQTKDVAQTAVGWDNIIKNNIIFIYNESTDYFLRMRTGWLDPQLSDYNLFYSDDVFGFHDMTNSTTKQSLELWKTYTSGLGYGATEVNSLSTNPQFYGHTANSVDPANYVPVSGSPAIDAGTAITLLRSVTFTDFYGNQVTDGWDIGAFQDTLSTPEPDPDPPSDSTIADMDLYGININDYVTIHGMATESYSSIMGLDFVVGTPYDTTKFYVSNDGSDSYSGNSPDSAWLTIAKVNAATLEAGDNVYFERGDTWREQLTIDQSGSVGSPITFGAYGTGARPIFNGADVETGWKSENGGGTTVLIDDDMSSDNTGDWSVLDQTVAFDTDHYELTYTAATQYLYQSSMGITSGDSVEISVDVKDGTISSGNTLVLRCETLLGNGGELSSTTGTTSSWVTKTHKFRAAADRAVISFSSNMAGAGNIEIKNFTANIIGSGDGTLWSLPITSTIGATGYNVIVIDDSLGNREYSKSAVDESLDYYISSGDSIYIFSATNPDSRTAEVSKRGYGTYILNQTYITVENIECRYAEYAGIGLRNNLTTTPIDGNNIISYCTTYYNFNNGITLFDNNDDGGMNNNLVEHCHSSYNGNGMYSIRSDDNVFSYDTLMHNIAYTTPFSDGHGVGLFESDSSIVEYCYGFENLGGAIGYDMNHDGGYSGGGDGIIRYNKLYNTSGISNSGCIGLHERGDSAVVEIYYNLMYVGGADTARPPVFTVNDVSHTSPLDESYLYIYNNTFVANNDSTYRAVSIDVGDDVTMKNNIFYTTSKEHLTTSYALNFGTDGIGTVDLSNNLYYAPNATNFIKYDDTNYSDMGTYQTASSQDANSVEDNPDFTTEFTDFTLQSGSPAVNAGTDVGLTEDILGNPISGNPDMGCYEYQP